MSYSASQPLCCRGCWAAQERCCGQTLWLELPSRPSPGPAAGSRTGLGDGNATLSNYAERRLSEDSAIGKVGHRKRQRKVSCFKTTHPIAAVYDNRSLRWPLFTLADVRRCYSRKLSGGSAD